MEFALLFILAFLVGLLVYLISNQWMLSVGTAIGLFLISVFSDGDAEAAWKFSLIFGVPIVFVGSLLGPYVVELRRGGSSEDDENDSTSRSEE